MSDESATRWERPPESLADEAAPPDVPIGKPVLKAIEIVAGYIPEVNILNGCNLVVNPAEFVGIIGPNGAGKSTLLKAILGQCSVRSG
ncbi:MAG TPA: ATP-binding cassette domain-containing protein, partial [Ilumatobacter sp.]